MNGGGGGEREEKVIPTLRTDAEVARRDHIAEVDR